MKKLIIAAFALVLGAVAAQAENLASLGIYCKGDGSVEIVKPLPKYVYVSKSIRNKDGSTSFPCFINIDRIQSVELKFKVTGDITVYASLYAFRRPGHNVIPLLCNKFEYNGESIPGIPGVIDKWKRMLTRNLKDGDTFTLALSLEKQEE